MGWYSLMRMMEYSEKRKKRRSNDEEMSFEDFVILVKFILVLSGAGYLLFRFGLKYGLILNLMLLVYSILRIEQKITAGQFYFTVILFFLAIYFTDIDILPALLLFAFTAVFSFWFSRKTAEYEAQKENSAYSSDKIVQNSNSAESDSSGNGQEESDFDQLLIRALEVPHYYLGKYIPANAGIQDEFSGLLLMFKKYGSSDYGCRDDIVEYFLRKVINLIKKNALKPDIIVPVPSSRSYNIGKANEEICRKISAILGIENGVNALVRIWDVPKSSTSDGKERPTLLDHYRSIITNPRFNLKDKNVLLFDDIYTTGNTARASALRLLEAGAKNVWIVTLGKTKEWD